MLHFPCGRALTRLSMEAGMNPDRFDDGDIIICYGGAKPTDTHLASTVHCIDDEIIAWPDRREQRRRNRLLVGPPSWAEPIYSGGRRTGPKGQ